MSPSRPRTFSATESFPAGGELTPRWRGPTIRGIISKEATVAAKALGELVGKTTRVGYDGSYYDCKIIAVDPQVGWINILNTESEGENAVSIWYPLSKIDYIFDK
jgi:hypothetical protein